MRNKEWYSRMHGLLTRTHDLFGPSHPLVLPMCVALGTITNWVPDADGLPNDVVILLDTWDRCLAREEKRRRRVPSDGPLRVFAR